jgi:hypothetical protein
MSFCNGSAPTSGHATCPSSASTGIRPVSTCRAHCTHKPSWHSISSTSRSPRMRCSRTLANIDQAWLQERQEHRNQHISRRLLGRPGLQLVLGVIADVRPWLSTRRANSALRVFVRHHFGARRQLDPDHVRAGFGGITDQDRQARLLWKSRKRSPLHSARIAWNLPSSDWWNRAPVGAVSGVCGMTCLPGGGRD